MPNDIYTHPQFYTGDPDSIAFKETVRALRQAKGRPDALVTIYRAAPKAELNKGDWVTLSKQYAQQHGMADDPSLDVPVHSFKVRASDLVWSMDALEEFGYYPQRRGPRTMPVDNPKRNILRPMRPSKQPDN